MEITLKGKILQRLFSIMNEMPYKFAKPIEMILAEAEEETLSNKDKKEKKGGK